MSARGPSHEMRIDRQSGGGRIWRPSWLDERARDQTGAAAVTLGWLPFEGVYAAAGWS